MAQDRLNLGATSKAWSSGGGVFHQPGSACRVDSEADWYLIGGDETALPAIATLLETLAAPCHTPVFIEVADGEEMKKLESPARLEITWLHHDRIPGKSAKS